MKKKRPILNGPEGKLGILPRKLQHTRRAHPGKGLGVCSKGVVSGETTLEYSFGGCDATDIQKG